MNVINTLKHKGYTIKVVQDEELAHSPRENDNLGKLVCFHNRYTLPHEADYDFKDYSGWDGMENAIAKDAVVILPVYMYDHSGLTINTTGFSCPWDSGRIGFIFASKKDVVKEFGKVTPEIVATIKGILEAEVQEYSAFLEGNVYGFIVESPDGKELDSCWGFIGDPEKSGLIEQAKDAVDSELRAIGEQQNLFPQEVVA
jgi:hypothetical protein